MDRNRIPITDYIAWLDAVRGEGLMDTSGCWRELKQWVHGEKFPRGYALLDGFICRWGQDNMLTPDHIDAIRLDVLGPKPTPVAGLNES